ncbi:MAG: glutamate synthase [Oscillospiraceae bacterium]|jgi:glutamate synthase domain-containing protein 3|nr:glutamate synthase [Oscillospiraceae bacterium]
MITTIDAAPQGQSMHFSALGEQLRTLAGQSVKIEHCLGQRYIAAGIKDIRVEIEGIPGNALGAYLGAGSSITVRGNAQDATGDTMSGGTITIHGSTGDAAGYGMRGGVILVEGNAGYRAGIHMKEYGETCPKLVIGGRAGDFLGEYQAGGIIVVLGLGNQAGAAPLGRFCGTGQHGGRMFIRGEVLPPELPAQVAVRKADAADRTLLQPLLAQFSAAFGADLAALESSPYFLLTPNSSNPYTDLYAIY